MTPEPGTIVTVHMNLNNVKQGKPRWSIKVSGKVVCNVEHVVLSNCTPLVTPGGHREVYAKVKGTLVNTGLRLGETLPKGYEPRGPQEVHLNQHRTMNFTHTDGTAYTGSPMAYFNKDSFFTV
jgi:hypothetical protein